MKMKKQIFVPILSSSYLKAELFEDEQALSIKKAVARRQTELKIRKRNGTNKARSEQNFEIFSPSSCFLFLSSCFFHQVCCNHEILKNYHQQQRNLFQFIVLISCASFSLDFYPFLLFFILHVYYR